MSVNIAKKPLIIEESSSSPSISSTDTSSSSSPVSSSSNIPSTSSNATSSSSLSPAIIQSKPNPSPVNSCKYNLEEEFKGLDCSNENYYSKECNKFLLKKEFIEQSCIAETPNADNYLYPSLSDKNFNIKIATKKEFNDTKYDGEIHKNIKEYADELSKADFELSPHQAFVKNFMSAQTPYNSLMLYHGLGTGKTCSAIGVCEEMRNYMKQIGTTKRIIIVASENVQDNFKLQLFDERKLKLVDGVWNIRACTGNKLLQEINPMNMKGIPREKVISQIKNLINTYYLFLGYGQFANYIIKTIDYSEDVDNKVKTKKNEIALNKKTIRRLRNEFDNRLIVIDEVHNIRKTEDNENKKVAINLELLVKSAENMRFVLLSATPMYNSYKEIVWLLNLMNTNDRRGRIDVKDIFEKNGGFKKNGEEILIRKATGYISFVRGENPYTFPYRVYPNLFAPNKTFPFVKYPKYQMNLKKIKESDKNRILSLYLNTIKNCNKCGKCQGCVYNYIIYSLRNKEFSITTKKGLVRDMPSFENMESFGYTLLQLPLESLIISYPIDHLKEIMDDVPKESYSDALSEDFSDSVSENGMEVDELPGIIPEAVVNEEEPINVAVNLSEKPLDPEATSSNSSSNSNSSSSEVDTDKMSYNKSGGNVHIDPRELTGKKGLERMMDFVDEKSPPEKGKFKYKSSIVHKYGRIFSQDVIGNYSIKIKSILDSIYEKETDTVSEGIILIYSQYIDSGLIPMALALEEMGFTRYGENSKPLFKTHPSPIIDVRTMKEPTDKKNFIPARYSMITGDGRLSPNNDFEVKGLTNDNNKDGNKIKVVLISKAGSEGIDLKFIRQVHILEPWYNMNRIEQIIGRAVRNFSHKDLEFEKRNVQIFMHGTILGNEKNEESADLYVYRVAEFKAIQIGKVSRILKETSVDCIINHDQTNFTQAKIAAILDEPITQELSTGLVINDFKIGDEPFSPACDYMPTCDYTCRPTKKINEQDLNEDTYNENFIVMNSEKITQRIRMLMKESFFYKKDVLINAIQTPKKYPYVQIYSALTQLIDDNNEFIVDKYGRNGRLVNIDEYYLFQPIELRDKNVSIFDRTVPIDFKHGAIKFEIKQDIVKPVIDTRNLKNLNEFVNIEGKRVLDELNANFELSKEYISLAKVPRGDDNWYKHSGIVIQKISKEYPEMKEYLLEFLTAHMIEQLFYNDKIELINYLYALKEINKHSLTWYLMEYFKRKTIVTKKFKCIIMYNLNKFKLMILNINNKWVESEPEDQREIASSKEVKDLFTFNATEYNRYIGFIGYKKNNSALVFKTKDMDSKRDTGATCEESGKEKTIQKLNSILGEDKYTSKNTKLEKDSDGNVIREAIGQTELCIFQEFILRYYDIVKKGGKRWFLTPEMAIYYKLYKIIM